MFGAVAQSGGGIPGSYPIAVNQPLDRAYLRPLQEPLVDTEEYSFSSPATSITYFQRPISQNTAVGTYAKTEAETNLNQSSMLDYPKEFSILGFNIVMDYTIGLESQSLIYRRAWFQFTFSGRRPYLQIPLNRIPQGQYLNGAVAMGSISATTTNAAIITQFANGMGHVANYYRFNLGRAALKIKPGEAFNGKINFPVAPSLPTTLNNNYGKTPTAPATWWVSLFLIGLSWMPL